MPGLLGGIARTAVAAGTATAVRNRVTQRQAERWAAQGRAAPAYMADVPAGAGAPMTAEAPPPPAPAAPAADPAEELRKYAELRDQGVITNEDFEAKKKQLLGI